MTIEELAGVLARHPATIRRWVKVGIIVGTYPGGLRGLGLRFQPEGVARQFRQAGMGCESVAILAWANTRMALVG